MSYVWPFEKKKKNSNHKYLKEQENIHIGEAEKKGMFAFLSVNDQKQFEIVNNLL